MKFRLHRSVGNKMLGGVCGGLAESFDTDVTLIRVMVFLLCVFQPFIIVLYFILMAVLPVGEGSPVENDKDGSKTDESTNAEQKTQQSQSTENVQREKAAGTQSAYAANRRVYTKPEHRERHERRRARRNDYEPASSEEQAKANRQETPRRDDNGEPIEPKSNFGTVLFGVMMICAGIGIVVAKNVFGYSITISEVITYVLLAVGLFFLISGVSEGTNQKKGANILKIIFGILTLYISVSRMIDISSFAYITKDYILYAVQYLWPVLLVVIIITLFIPNKKRAVKVWLLILIIVFVAALFIKIWGYPLL